MYTSREAVLALLALAGQTATGEELEQAIADATFVVQQFDFAIEGKCTSDGKGIIYDENARFLGRVMENARVTHGQNVTAVKKVLTMTSLETANPNLTFAAGDDYRIEDLQRYELAERYKAASIIMGAKISQGTAFAPGASERLGPIAVSSGHWTSSWAKYTGATNAFEEEFQKIAGSHFATV